MHLVQNLNTNVLIDKYKIYVSCTTANWQPYLEHHYQPSFLNTLKVFISLNKNKFLKRSYLLVDCRTVNVKKFSTKHEQQKYIVRW